MLDFLNRVWVPVFDGDDDGDSYSDCDGDCDLEDGNTYP